MQQLLMDLFSYSRLASGTLSIMLSLAGKLLETPVGAIAVEVSLVANDSHVLDSCYTHLAMTTYGNCEVFLRSKHRFLFLFLLLQSRLHP